MNSILPTHRCQCPDCPVNHEGIATENLSDPYNHFIGTGERYFKGCYLKIARSKNISFKQFQILPTAIVNPDEIDDTYVSINESLQLDIDAYNYLIQKASS